jgi:sigma-E factor negative regulatory protein RseA
MNTKERTQEQISALADGELSDSQIEIALAALRTPHNRADWDVYHQIGDILRSDDMAVAMSPDFGARMAARLEAEPAIIAPLLPRESQAAPALTVASSASSCSRLKRLAMPGMAAAAVATAVFVTTPHLLVAKQEPAPGTGTAIVMVADPRPETPELQAAVATEAKMVAMEQQEGVVLRDPRIDEYLMAHQRFSPSVLSTAQYSRSATFATEAGK